jgi:hypothetical protein
MRSTASTKTRTTISSVATSRYWKSSIELKMRELVLAHADDVWEALDDVVTLATLAAEQRRRVRRLRAGRFRCERGERREAGSSAPSAPSKQPRRNTLTGP